MLKWANEIKDASRFQVYRYISKGFKIIPDEKDLKFQRFQVVVGSIIADVGVVTSFVSILTQNELMNMAPADDIDVKLMDSRNNILTTI